MFGRRILAAAAAAFVAAVSAQTLTITNPSPTSWWVADSINTLAWTCGTTPSSFNVVLTNTNTSILTAALTWLPNIPNYDCSYTVSAQLSTLTPSDTWTMELTDITNTTNIYTSTSFSIKPYGSIYPTTSSASGTSTSTAGSSSSTSTSNKNGAIANYIPVGMSMAAAIALGLVVA